MYSMLVNNAGEDIEKVISLRIAFMREMEPDARELEAVVIDSTRRYVSERLPAGKFLVWFAEEDGQIIGTSGLIFFRRPPTFRCASDLHAYILNMYTQPEWRGKGVATMLLKHIIEYVRTTPTKHISLHASDMGRSVYEKIGFKISSAEMVLTLD
jgi:GNAT superfamily N-acetyltransferase